ncbi:MAG: pseudouridine synthase [Oscillospiraceae bacterium]|nr:pseudouridine synthase [Oscillospiraceae bacterium]
MEQMRIQKYLSDCGIMSRRKAEEEISAGRVFINGAPAVTGQKVDPNNDAVVYNGILVEKTDRRIYIKLYKPRGYVVTMSDEKGRKCITELVNDIPERIYPIGRLDLDSEGLILMTNDGEFANRLMHPSTSVDKVYIVKLKSSASPEQIIKLNSPMVIDGYRIRPCKVIVESGFDASILKFVLGEGRNRQIRKMCLQAGLDVSRLTRIAIGKITLGDLKSGAYEKLTKEQIDYLKGLA